MLIMPQAQRASSHRRAVMPVIILGRALTVVCLAAHDPPGKTTDTANESLPSRLTTVRFVRILPLGRERSQGKASGMTEVEEPLDVRCGYPG